MFSPQSDTNLTTHTECVDVEVLEDRVLEDSEYFVVNLTSEVGSIRVYVGTISVVIADNDYIFVGLEKLIYNVEEEDIFVTVCVEARGEMNRTASSG